MKKLKSILTMCAALTLIASCTEPNGKAVFQNRSVTNSILNVIWDGSVELMHSCLGYCSCNSNIGLIGNAHCHYLNDIQFTPGVGQHKYHRNRSGFFYAWDEPLALSPFHPIRQDGRAMRMNGWLKELAPEAEKRNEPAKKFSPK